MLHIAKPSAEEIVAIQETLGARKHGSRKKIIKKFINIYRCLIMFKIHNHIIVLEMKEKEKKGI